MCLGIQAGCIQPELRVAPWLTGAKKQRPQS